MPELTFFLQTFGCKSNQYESQAIREDLLALGFIETADPAAADCAVVNTCGVTGRAGASCRNAIRKIRRANPFVRLIVTGCAVDLGLPMPDLSEPKPVYVPNAKKYILAQLTKEPAASFDLDAAPPDRFAQAISSFHGHTRAFLKVQDGCDNFCSYCAVPFARGGPVSRAPEEVLAEARRLTGHGHKEIVLTGINIGAYSHSGLELGDLAEALAETPGLERLRLGSVEPPYVNERLVKAMASSTVICPHVHLPLQAGDDAVLAAMGRRYTRSEFLEKAAMLKEGLHLPALTTDVIVGFPVESEEAVDASREVCEAVGFSRLHVFLFSARPGTKAEEMRRTATDADIERRKKMLMDAGRRLAENYAQACVGMDERVLVEKSGAGLSDRYLRVMLPEILPSGSLRRVRATRATGVDLHGEFLAE